MSSHPDESGHHPDLCGICLVAAFVVWRSGTLGSLVSCSRESSKPCTSACADATANAPWKLSTKD